MTLPFSLAFYCMGIALACSVGALVIAKARQERRLSQARLSLSRTISEVNHLLLSQEIKSSQLCHNEVYNLMLALQFMEEYPSPSVSLFKKGKDSEFKRRLIEETRDASPKLRELLNQFSASYYALFCAKYPLKSIFLLGAWTTQLFVARGLYWSLQQIINFLAHKKDRAVLRSKNRISFGHVLASFAYQEVKSGKAPRFVDAILSPS